MNKRIRKKWKQHQAVRGGKRLAKLIQRLGGEHKEPMPQFSFEWFAAAHRRVQSFVRLIKERQGAGWL